MFPLSPNPYMTSPQIHEENTQKQKLKKQEAYRFFGNLEISLSNKIFKILEFGSWKSNLCALLKNPGESRGSTRHRGAEQTSRQATKPSRDGVTRYCASVPLSLACRPAYMTRVNNIVSLSRSASVKRATRAFVRLSPPITCQPLFFECHVYVRIHKNH